MKKSNIQRPYIRFIPTEKAPGQIVLKVKGITKAYDGQKVIDNFSIEMLRGDKIGIIGPNGRGKTTLVKMLSSALAADGFVKMAIKLKLAIFLKITEMSSTKTKLTMLLNG